MSTHTRARRAAIRPAVLRHQVGALHIVAPPNGTTPSARSWCACGRERTATGTAAVLVLIAQHAAHRGTCPHHTPDDAGRAAA
ncbi:hypothetical protein RM574_20240 [Streptomyces sp. DSM 41982]|uniref:Uncharacterized protein n=1 Tax=Streptomyces evansiae TaxID=3075535 RepID=A0ABD5E8R6_9ACTN|nr:MULTISPECIES: hypothetical protein [unclassified Streptomyces]MDT0417816.1 hypothetical protein [Streptomyces sp. DSM 41982]SCE11331.1 hypothetical protein GA0115246_1109018 [Streptomyces sp. SolWspMP-sol7th]